MTVKMDPYWNMPVFVTNGGQSSCPWLENTMRRQVAQISVTEPALVDIPPEEPAVFTVLLGNNSDTGEDGTYYLTVDNSFEISKPMLTKHQMLFGNGKSLFVYRRIFNRKVIRPK